MTNINIKEIDINGNKLRIKKFDLSQLTKNTSTPLINIIGKRGCGKSLIIKTIMNYHDDIPGGIVISNTEKTNPFYKKFFPDTFIYNEYDSKILRSILKRQEKIIEKKHIFEQNKVETINANAWLILDNCLPSKGIWLKDEEFQQIVYHGQCYRLFRILSMAYPIKMPPEIRAQFNFIFLFAEDFLSIQHEIYKKYAGTFPTFKIFKSIFEQCTKNYGCMIIDCRVRSGNIEDMIFWWCADPVENSNKLIGSKSFIDYHNKNYDKKQL